MVSKATESINMSMMAVGAADYAKAIDGLSLSQAKLLLSLQGVDAEQQKSLLLQAGLISSSEQMQAKHVAQALTTTTLETSERNRILTKLGLIDVETGEILTSQTCTKEKLLQALATTTLDEEEKQALVTKILGTTANGSYAISFKVLTGAIWENIKALAKWMVTNPVGQIGLTIAAIGLLRKGYDSIITSKERLADTKLEGLDDEISNLDAEIQSLETLQGKLKDAKGDKAELAQIQNELNDAIGDTPGLLNGEGKAYDVANAKLKAYIESKKQERDAAKQNKIDASKEKFDNNAYEADGWFGFDATAEQMREWAKMYQGFVDYFNNLPDDSEIRDRFKDADEYAQSVFKMTKGDMDMQGWTAYWDEQVQVAYDAFDAVIEDYEGYGGQDFLKNMISNMVRSGADFTEISNAIQAVMDNEQMQEAINTYWESLVNPDIDSEKALENVKKAFDEIIKLYPGLEGFFDGVYERIISGGNKVADSTEENANKMTVSLSDLIGASDKIGKLSSAFKELSDDGYITTKTIGEIQEATGLAGDEWAGYEQKLLNAKKGSAEFNQVMSDLTYKIVENAFAGKDLTDTTEDQIAAVLRENGVVNANAVAHDIATKAKAKEKAKGFELCDSIDATKAKLIEEAKSCGISTAAYAQLVAQETIFNNNTLDISDKVAKLASLQQSLGQTTSMAIGLNNALAGRNLDDRLEMTMAIQQYGIKRTGKGYEYNGVVYKSGQDAVNAAMTDDFTKNIKVDIPKIVMPDYSGSSKDSGSNKSSNDKTQFDDSYYSTVNAWLEENKKQIERFEKEREKLNRQFENALDTGNKEQAEILRDKLAENAKMQKDILHQQNEAHRITQGQLLQSLYQYAPSLSGKSWDEISEVDLINIENALNRASETASDDNKNQAKYNLNQFKGIVDDLKTLNDTIEDNSESWWQLDENAKGYWQSQIDFQDDYSNTWIDNQKAFDKLSEEEELAAYGRMINNNKEFQKQILNDTSISEDAKLALIKETNDKIVEIEKNAYDLRKDIFNKATDLGSSYIDSKKTLLQSYFDVTNSIADAQHEINKELETSKTMYEYLDEETRKLLFNQEDYNILSEELYDIQYKADKLKRQYERDLENSTLSTVEAITSNYEMQYETLMKSYEIAKADLEIAKKKQKLNNVLNERNVRMFINGQWQWVANTEDVINAKSELADAEYARKTAMAGERQAESINNLVAQQDELSTIISEFGDGVITLDDAIKEIVKKFSDLPNAVYSQFREIQTDNSTKNKSVSYGSSTSVSSEYASWAKSQMAANSAKWHTASSTEKTALEKANQTLGSAIGSTYDSATGTWKHKYASGTRSALPGFAELGENEPEMFISNNGHLIPINQPTIANLSGGEAVFNGMQMKNIRTLWDLSNINFSRRFEFAEKDRVQKTETIDNSIHINGLTIGEQGNEDWINGLKRYVYTHAKM